MVSPATVGPYKGPNYFSKTMIAILRILTIENYLDDSLVSENFLSIDQAEINLAGGDTCD
jgi:hypothetical protein